jgi:hypothetical protein
MDHRIASYSGIQVDNGPIVPVADVADFSAARGYLTSYEKYEDFVQRGKSRDIARTWRPTPRSGTHVGTVMFHNDTASEVRVTLFHKTAPGRIENTWEVAPGAQQRLDFRMDDTFGITIDTRPIRLVGEVSDWNGEFVIRASRF